MCQLESMCPVMRASTLAPGGAEAGSRARSHLTWLAFGSGCWAKAEKTSRKGRLSFSAPESLIIIKYRRRAEARRQARMPDPQLTCRSVAFIAQFIFDALVDAAFGKLLGHANGVLDGVCIGTPVANDADAAHTQ